MKRREFLGTILGVPLCYLCVPKTLSGLVERRIG